MDASQLFDGTAEYYHNYRKPIPVSILAQIMKYCPQNLRSHLLDIGCATGRNTINFAKDIDLVTGLDPNTEMIALANEYMRELQITNVRYVQSTAESYKPEESVGIVFFGSSFHWLDQHKTLENLKKFCLPNARFIVQSSSSSWNSNINWEKEVNKILQKHLGANRRAGTGYFEKQLYSFKEILEKSSIGVIINEIYPYPYNISIEDYIGFLLSTSYANKTVLGTNYQVILDEIKNFLLLEFPDNNISKVDNIELIIGKLAN